MTVLNKVKMTWPQLRNLADSHMLVPRLNYLKLGKWYRTWLEYGGETYEACFTEGHSHGVEFVADYLPNVVNQVGDSGYPYMTTSPTPYGAVRYRRSFQYTAGLNTTAIYDLRVGPENKLVGAKGLMYLFGGEYECRTTAVQGCSLEFSIVDRDDVSGAFSGYSLNTCRLTGITSESGVLAVGEVVTGGSSGATGIVISVASGVIGIRADNDGVWTDAEALSAPGGYAGTLGTYDEGDVLSLIIYVEDEFIEGLEARSIGVEDDSNRVITGYYLRTEVFNADVVGPDDLRVKVTLKVGKE